MLHADITQKIIAACYTVAGELGCGFLESVYEKALAVALRQMGLNVQCQHPIKVFFRGECVGEFIADLLVEGCVIVELKSAKAIAPEYMAQVINYLKASGIDVGLLVNFGTPRIGIRRLTRNKQMNRDGQDIQDEEIG